LSPVLLAVAAVLVAVVLFAIQSAYALRDFSRSRLDEFCRRRGLENRFGEILRGYEPALLAVEIWILLAAAGLFILLMPALGGRWTAPETVWTGVSLALRGLFALAAVGFVTLVLPWSIARVAGEPFLAWAWPLIRAMRTLVAPLLSAAVKFDTLAHRVAGVPEPANGSDLITEEIRSVVDEGEREGLVDQEARSMIHRVMEMKDEDVAAVMTPRTEMNVVPVDATLEQARERLLESGHSRMPVVGETIDDIVGILYAKDLLEHLAARNGKPDAGPVSLREVVRDPIYVPDTTHIDKLLERMKRERIHIAIVIDEYSGVAGLVTLEDILEEIVGEITDEYDPEAREGIRPVGPDTIDVDARVHIDDLNERFEFDLPEDRDYETVGGFVLNRLGRVPKSRDHFTWRQLRVTVLEADDRRIHRLRIERDRTLAATAVEES
jgi:CBS domain containing-hemolysin-like protein